MVGGDVWQLVVIGAYASIFIMCSTIIFSQDLLSIFLVLYFS